VGTSNPPEIIDVLFNMWKHGKIRKFFVNFCSLLYNSCYIPQLSHLICLKIINEYYIDVAEYFLDKISER
jgi:hypothetical protein